MFKDVLAKLLPTIACAFFALGGQDAEKPEKKVLWGDQEQYRGKFIDDVRPVPAVLYTPASAYDLAYADAQAIDKAGGNAADFRWLSSYNEWPEDIIVTGQVASFVANSLNVTLPFAAPLGIVEGTEGRLLRINLKLLGIRAKDWDDLGRLGSGPAPFPEPWFHEVVVKEKVRKFKSRKTGKTITRREKSDDLGQASWLNEESVKGLLKLTDSEFPVYRTDWFIAYALVYPAYYRFLGNPKDIDDFYRLAGVNKKDFLKRGALLRAAVVFSEVALRNRALEMLGTRYNYGRGYWAISYDFKTSLNTQDVINNALQRKADANEIIWATPAGLQGYGVVDGNGQVLNKADDDVAQDHRTSVRDGSVRVAHKCAFCHAQGLNVVEDEVRLLPRTLRAAFFTTKGKRVANEVADYYFGEDFNRLVFVHQGDYAVAVERACGLAPAAIALHFQAVIKRYFDTRIQFGHLAMFSGYPVEQVKAVIAAAAQPGVGVGIDHSFVRLLQRRRARIDQLEVAFPQLMRLLVQSRTLEVKKSSRKKKEGG